MRWNKRQPPKVGDKRVITRFAIWPIQLSCGTVVWLEKYKVMQAFRELTEVRWQGAFETAIGGYMWITVQRWVDIEIYDEVAFQGKDS